MTAALPPPRRAAGRLVGLEGRYHKTLVRDALIATEHRVVRRVGAGQRVRWDTELGGEMARRADESFAAWLRRRARKAFRASFPRPPEPPRDFLEEHVVELIRHLGVELLIDVGANEGQFVSRVRRAGFEGRVVSFEPLPSAFARLTERAARDPNWECLPVALGHVRETRVLYEARASVLSSMLPSSRFAAEIFARQADVANRIDVEVRTLDEMWTEIHRGGSAPRCFLKMDTQGFDLEVFRGAAPRMDSIWGLQSELSLRALYEGMPSHLDALATYRAAGFCETGFFPVFRDESTLLLGEVDCVLARSVEGVADRSISILD